MAKTVIYERPTVKIKFLHLAGTLARDFEISPPFVVMQRAPSNAAESKTNDERNKLRSSPPPTGNDPSRKWHTEIVNTVEDLVYGHRLPDTGSWTRTVC